MINSFLVSYIVLSVNIFSLMLLLLVFMLFNSYVTYDSIKKFSVMKAVNGLVSCII